MYVERIKSPIVWTAKRTVRGAWHVIEQWIAVKWVDRASGETTRVIVALVNLYFDRLWKQRLFTVTFHHVICHISNLDDFHLFLCTLHKHIRQITLGIKINNVRNTSTIENQNFIYQGYLFLLVVYNVEVFKKCLHSYWSFNEIFESLIIEKQKSVVSNQHILL